MNFPKNIAKDLKKKKKSFDIPKSRQVIRISSKYNSYWSSHSSGDILNGERLGTGLPDANIESSLVWDMA